MTSRTSAFRGFVVKEVRHILRDWQTLLILIGMPVAQVVLFGYAIRSDVRGVRVAIVEPVGDAATASLRARFEQAVDLGGLGEPANNLELPRPNIRPDHLVFKVLGLAFEFLEVKIWIFVTAHLRRKIP